MTEHIGQQGISSNGQYMYFLYLRLATRKLAINIRNDTMLYIALISSRGLFVCFSNRFSLASLSYKYTAHSQRLHFFEIKTFAILLTASRSPPLPTPILAIHLGCPSICILLT